MSSPDEGYVKIVSSGTLVYPASPRRGAHDRSSSGVGAQWGESKTTTKITSKQKTRRILAREFSIGLRSPITGCTGQTSSRSLLGHLRFTQQAPNEGDELLSRGSLDVRYLPACSPSNSPQAPYYVSTLSRARQRRRSPRSGAPRPNGSQRVESFGILSDSGKPVELVRLSRTAGQGLFARHTINGPLKTDGKGGRVLLLFIRSRRERPLKSVTFFPPPGKRIRACP